jgi:hypothetical protein
MFRVTVKKSFRNPDGTKTVQESQEDVKHERHAVNLAGKIARIFLAFTGSRLRKQAGGSRFGRSGHQTEPSRNLWSLGGVTLGRGGVFDG